jgi:PelA/Pel-15E family pectate lyase
MLYLMGLPSPSPAVVAAVHAAAAWFQKTELHGVAFRRDPATGDRALLKDPSSVSLWARYYEIGSDKPLFGDRDKSIHDDVSEISRERRNGYSWFNDSPAKVLKAYASWAPQHPDK